MTTMRFALCQKKHTWMQVEGVHGTTSRMGRAVGYLPPQILTSDLNLPILETTLQPF